MTEPRRGHRRRRILSNPREQLKIVVAFFVLAVLYAATNYGIAKGVLWSVSSDLMGVPLSPANRADVDMILEQQALTVDMQLALFTVLILVTLTLAGLLMSHRLAGPLYQLRTYLRLMARGEVTPRHIRFRKQDFFHDLAAAFNDFQRSRGIVPADGPSPHEGSGGGETRGSPPPPAG
jgi:hypothetical protein